MEEIKRPEASHIWAREQHEHYVEPEWCSQRLFEVEKFDGSIWDPCCGFGRIVKSARAANYVAQGTDIVIRSDLHGAPVNFLEWDGNAKNVVCNPPFDIFEKFATHALARPGVRKVAMIWLVRTLPAARWLRQTPLSKVLLLTPRPSMPPGHTITAGEKPGGGKQDFCWLIWDKAHTGPASIGWLHRDNA